MSSQTPTRETSTVSSSESSTTSPATSPTTSPTSGLDPAGSHASTGIEYHHRILLVGATRTGKSHLARRLFLSAAAPRLVIDPADSKLTEIPGAVTFSDPTRASNDAGEYWTQAANARFVPSDPEDRDAYDAVYSWAFARYPRMVWCDEAGMVLPASGYPKRANAYVVQGAKRMLGHIACHTRPVEIARNLIAQAQHIFIFDLPHPADRATIAEVAGIDRATLEGHMAVLGKWEFLWWSQLDRQLTICPAVS